MAVNVFAPKKKYDQNGNLMSSNQPIQGSGYSSAYSSNASNYKAPTQPAVNTSSYKAPQPTPQPTPRQPIARPVNTQTQNTNKKVWGPMFVTRKPTAPGYKPVGGMSTAPLMSVAPPKAQNMSVDPNAKKYTPPPVAQPTPEPKTNVNADWLKYIGGAGANRTALEQQRIQDEMDFIKQRTSLSNQQLMEALPVAQEQFNQFKGNTEATIADLLAGGERQKGQAEDYYGDAQRQAAQTRRETQGQTQRTFANLGTLDSRGEGSFQQATENADSEFNRFTQQTLRAKADKLSEIDATIRSAERDARATITQEEAKMNQLARDIQYAVANNNLSEAQELTTAYNQSQSYIYDIQDSLAGAQYEFALAQQELENEIAQTQSFTPEFMATGNPTNQAEYEFFIKNKDAYNTSGKSKSASALQVEGKAGAGLRALQTIEAEILNNPSILAQANVPGSPGARQYEAAMSSITDAIGGLRTGASVSPEQQKYYRNILPKFGDSEETIKYKLNAVKQELEGYSQGSNNMSNDVSPELMAMLGL
jgi:hypothetical protein